MVRAVAVCFAMVTDGLDGYIARRYKMTSPVGTFLDPLMDKFFVLFVVVTLIGEERISVPETVALFCRDFSVILFGLYLAISSKLGDYRFRSIWCGKATTFLQFLVLLALTFGFAIPNYFYFIFIGLGLLALVELYLPLQSQQKT